MIRLGGMDGNTYTGSIGDRGLGKGGKREEAWRGDNCYTSRLVSGVLSLGRGFFLVP